MYEQLNINKFKSVNKINPFNILAGVDKKMYAAKYREENKEKVKESKKEHYEKNKERLLKQKNDYYYANKDEINKRVKEKITCDVCNSQVARGNYSEHTRSKKHIKNLNKE